MPSPHKHAVLIKAWADGATIQLLDRGKWTTMGGPGGDLIPGWYDDHEYRIKPQSVHRYAAVTRMPAGGIIVHGGLTEHRYAVHPHGGHNSHDTLVGVVHLELSHDGTTIVSATMEKP